MKYTKRFLCLLLTVCMLLAVVPAQVFARTVVSVQEDVSDEEIFSENTFYLASTNMSFSENTTQDYRVRIGRGGDCAGAASVTVKLEDFSARYGTDYTVSLDDGSTPDCPENAML